MRLRTLLILKICRFLGNFSRKNCSYAFFVKKIIYNLRLSLKNFIIGVGFFKNNDRETKTLKNQNCLKKLKNFPYLLIQSEFNKTKANFFPVSLKKKFLLKNFYRIKKVSKLKNSEEISVIIPFTKLSIIGKENYFAPLTIFNTKNDHSFLFKNKIKRINQRKTNTYQKFDKLVDYIKPERQPIVNVSPEIHLSKVLFNQILKI